MSSYLPAEIDTIYHFYFTRKGFDGKLTQKCGSLIQARFFDYGAFECIFKSSIEELHAYILSCINNEKCDLKTADYQSSWIYLLLESYMKDENNPMYKEAKRILFDINTMTHN